MGKRVQSMTVEGEKIKKFLQISESLKYYWPRWVWLSLFLLILFGLWGTAVWMFTNPLEKMLINQAAVARPSEAGPKLTADELPEDWCLVGDFQEWNGRSHPLQNDGTAGDLAANDSTYSLEMSIAEPGFYYWQVIECDNWEIIFPAESSWVNVTEANQTVLFMFTINGRSLNDDLGFPRQFILSATDQPSQLTIVGDFQEWVNDDPNTTFRPMANGITQKSITFQEPRTYNTYLVRTGSWEGYGGNGRSSDPIPFTVQTTAPNQTIHYFFNQQTGQTTILYAIPPTTEWLAWNKGWLKSGLATLALSLIPLALAGFFIFIYHPHFWLKTGCPNCKKHDLKRIPRQRFDYYLFLLGFPSYRFKCVDCGWIGRRVDSDFL